MPQPSRTRTSHGPMVAAEAPPASRYPVQRSRREQPGPAQPPGTGPAQLPGSGGAFPARRHQRPAGLDCDRGDRRPRPCSCPAYPQRRGPGQEEHRQGQDHDQARHDERGPAGQRARAAADPPGAEDRQLGGGGPREQVARGDRVLELPGVQPPLVVHAQLAQQRDVRGRAAEPDAADPPPLPQHGAQAGLVLSLRFTRGGIWRQAPSGRLLVGRVGGVRHRISRGQAGTARPDPPAPR